MSAAVLYSIDSWIEDNKKFFLPPVCNKLMHSEGQLKVFFVGGPNSRNDYHIEEGEEFFYMLKGDMVLKVVEHGKFKDIIIKEGETFLLPGRIPHSPQRSKDTIGLVIERERHVKEKDCLRYYVEGSDEILFERWFHCTDLGQDLLPIINTFKASEQFKTGKPGPGSIETKASFEPDRKKSLHKPFSLREKINSLKAAQAEGKCRQRMFEKSATDVFVIGKGKHSECVEDAEVFIWQIEGKSKVSCDGENFQLERDFTLLVPKNKRYEIVNEAKGCCLTICMPPAIKES